MTNQNDTVQSVRLLNEIIDNAASLPLECQDLILTLAKGMVFTKNVMIKNKDHPSRKAG